MNTIVTTLRNLFAPNLSAQVQQVEAQATQAAQIVAGWGIVIALELGVVIFLLARKKP